MCSSDLRGKKKLNEIFEGHMVGSHALPHEVSALYIYIYNDFNRTKIIKIGLSFAKTIPLFSFFFGETTLLVLEVYPVCTIGPLSLKRV